MYVVLIIFLRIVSENGKFLLSNHTFLISNCPLFQFFTVDSGVWMIPSTGTTAPQNIMLYWKNSTDFIKVRYIIIYSCVFKHGCVQLKMASLWSVFLSKGWLENVII